MPSYRNLVFSGSSFRSSIFTPPGSRLDFGMPVDEVAIHVVATMGAGYSVVHHYFHCHPVDRSLNCYLLGLVNFLDPFTWKPSRPAVVSAPLKFSLAPVSFRPLTSF